MSLLRVILNFLPFLHILHAFSIPHKTTPHISKSFLQMQSIGRNLLEKTEMILLTPMNSISGKRYLLPAR